MIGLGTEENDRIEYYNENIQNHNKYSFKIIFDEKICIRFGDVDY
jgi:hypothetical protein